MIDQIEMSSNENAQTILEKHRLNQVYVYGAGSAFHWVYEILVRIYKIDIAAVIDNKFNSGDILDGISCMNFDEFIKLGLSKLSLIIVSIANASISKEVIERFNLNGYKNVVRLIDIYEVHDPFQSRGLIDWSSSAKIIDEVSDFFEDEKSKNIYTSIISTHFSKRPIELPFDDEGTQNFDPVLTKNVSYQSTYMCGCGIHDLEVFLRGSNKHNVEQLICFEPEPKLYYGEHDGYFGLLNYIYANKNGFKFSCFAYPFAVSNTNTVEKFKSANQERGMRTASTSFGSRLSAEGLSCVQTISLDEFCKHEKPTALIIDAEGEELKIIDGARKIIAKDAPSVFIAVYHNVSHVWEVPAIIRTLNSNYKFYLRNYTGFCSETILYGICK